MTRPLSPPVLRLVPPPADPPVGTLAARDHGLTESALRHATSAVGEAQGRGHEGGQSHEPHSSSVVPGRSALAASGYDVLWAAIREPGPCTAWLLALNLGGEAS